MISDEFVELHAFPPALVPAFRSPECARLSEEARGHLAVQQLFRFLDFTQKLELLTVNRTALGAANGTLGFPVPTKMRQDAHKIYVDEAYHAMFSYDVFVQVQQVTRITPQLPATPRFLAMLRGLIHDHPGHSGLIEILFVIVSETLITGTLMEVAANSDVDPGVSNMMHDHASDEGRHHAYFKHLARVLWPSLTRDERELAGRILPTLMHGFAAPEISATRDDLLAVGVPDEQASAIIADIFSAELLTDTALLASRSTVQLFTDLGVTSLSDRMKEHLACAEW